MKRLTTLSLILFCLASTPAAPAQDNLARKFVGAWRLVSVEGTNATVPFAFDRPTGMLIYDQSGWMSVQIAVKGARKPFARGAASGTVEEKAAAFDSYIAYYGTYTVDAGAGTVNHHLQSHIYPGGMGAHNVRWFEFQGNDRLVLIPVEDGKGGVISRKDARYKLFWERIP
jgi:hypothetical protein